MPIFMQSIFLSAIILIFNNTARSEELVPEKPVKMTIQNISIDHKSYLAISYENFPGWHTYWKNPGDAGLAIKNQFFINKKEVKFPEEEWPAPKRFIENGTQWAYGYIGNYTHFFRLEKNDINKISGKNIQLNSTWLVCKHICIPGQKIIDFKISSDKLTTTSNDLLNPLDVLELNSRLLNLPKIQLIPEYLNFNLSKGQKDKTLILSYKVNKSTDTSFLKDANLIYSFPSPPFDFQHENLLTNSNDLSGTVEINWDGEYLTPPQALPTNGIFLKPFTIRFLFNDPVQRKVVVIEKTFQSFNLSIPPAISKTEFINQIDLVKINATQNSPLSSNILNKSLFYYMILAFLGGLILNIMPCVLPVISLKLFGLIKYQNESKARIIKHNLFYTIGIISTFMILAGIVLVFKTIGSQIGWGFQLQSPSFISIMIIVLFIFSLNMFGLFEFSTPGGKSLGNIQTEDGFLGDFLGGVLATILSTPCSAPFLGTALTFAFTSNSISIFLVFLMIGLGLAFPFILTGFFPALVSFLPKPGNWMNYVKKFLGLSLLFTIIWLLDVYNALVDGSAHLIKLASLLIFIFCGVIFLKKEKWISSILFLFAIIFFINLSTTSIIPSKDEQTALIRDKQAHGLNWEPWSYDKMKEYRDNNQIVFLDFTAKWCFTCKINEKLVLDTDTFKQFVIDNNLKLLIGDWTKRDEIIGGFLKQNGLVGVPAYFIIKKDGTLINLGETITLDKLKNNLN